MAVYFRIDTSYDTASGAGSVASPFDFPSLRTAMATYKANVALNFDVILLGTRAEPCARTIEDDFGNLINESSVNRRIKFQPES